MDPHLTVVTAPLDPELAAARRQRLHAALMTLDPIALELEDHSQEHAGHASAGGLGHYRVRIVAAVFSGKSQVERHRMVFRAVGPLLQTDVHALIIEAVAPEEPGATQ
jgi:BolA protein